MKRVTLTVAALVTLTAGTAFGQDDGLRTGLVILSHDSPGALTMTGNSRIEIPARVVYVNSRSATAVDTTGSAVLDAPMLYLVGGARFNAQSRLTGELHVSMVPYEDPYAPFPVPSSAAMVDRGSGSVTGGSVTLEPGLYSQGITISGSANVTLMPGVYVIEGSGLRISSGTVTGTQVGLLVTAGSVDIAGNSVMTLSPPTSGTMRGIVLAQPDSNTNDMHLAGGSETSILGTIYGPRARLTMVGTSDVEGRGPQMGDLVVVDRLTMRGTAVIRIGREELPPISVPVLPLYD